MSTRNRHGETSSSQHASCRIAALQLVQSPGDGRTQSTKLLRARQPCAMPVFFLTSYLVSLGQKGETSDPQSAIVIQWR